MAVDATAFVWVICGTDSDTAAVIVHLLYVSTNSLFINVSLPSLDGPTSSAFCRMFAVQRPRSLSEVKHPTETSLTYHHTFFV